MAEPKDVLVENLKETLKGVERYLLLGSALALFILLLADSGKLAVGAVAQEVNIPIVGLSAPSPGAALIALAIYTLLGWMIFGLVRRVQRIKNKLTQLDEEKLLDAALTYPSMITTGKTMPVIATLFVAALGTSALLMSFYDSDGFNKALVTGLGYSHSYFAVAFYLWRWPLHEPSGTSSNEKSTK